MFTFQLVDDNDVIVKVTGSTICGSDLQIMHGQLLQTEQGDIPGHEFCGIIDSVGSAVDALKPGERVVNAFAISCGECEFCRLKLTTACERTKCLITAQEHVRIKDGWHLWALLFYRRCCKWAGGIRSCTACR